MSTLLEARNNMIRKQCRTWDILDENILTLMETVSREDFVPTPYFSLAYADMSIPLGHEQKMLVPKEEAKILARLQIQSSERVLEIGTGSGYFTALLTHLAKHVDSIELFEDFHQEAAKKFQAAHIYNVMPKLGDANTGYQIKHLLYDVIVITGGLYTVPKNYLSCLTQGGRLFLFYGQAPAMQAMLVTKLGDQQYRTEILFETVIPMLINAPHHQKFRF